MLIDTKRSGKIGKDVRTFWTFNPEKIGISPSDIIRDQPSEEIPNNPSLEKFNTGGSG